MNEKEFDFVQFISEIWNQKRILFLFIVLSLIVGVTFAILTPRKYTSEVIIVPELNSGYMRSSGLRTLSSITGIGLDRIENQQDAIYPAVFPTLFQSTDFLAELFDFVLPEAASKDGVAETYIEHIGKGVSVLFPRKLILKRNDKNPLFTEEESVAIDYMRKNIFCTTDELTSIITIRVTDYIPLAAHVLADSLCVRLKTYITKYRTEKAKQNLAYFVDVFNTRYEDYLSAMKKYSELADSNLNPSRFSTNAQLSFFKDECNLRYQMYSEASKNLDLAKIRVQENIPIFVTIQNATFPTKPSGMPRKMIVAIWLVIGLVCDGLWVNYIKYFIKKKD